MSQDKQGYGIRRGSAQRGRSPAELLSSGAKQMARQEGTTALSRSPRSTTSPEHNSLPSSGSPSLPSQPCLRINANFYHPEVSHLLFITWWCEVWKTLNPSTFLRNQKTMPAGCGIASPAPAPSISLEALGHCPLTVTLESPLFKGAAEACLCPSYFHGFMRTSDV